MRDLVMLVDFGATRIKSILWSLADGSVVDSRECAAPLLHRGARGEAEGDPEHYWQALESTAGELMAANPNVQDLWLCSEMHGFVLAVPQSGEPLTNYISWQDQRACYKTGQEHSTLEKLSLIGTSLMKECGVRLRPGLPIANLANMQAEIKHHGPVWFLTLVDWLLVRGGESSPRCHPTLAAGTGLYSLTDGTWSQAIMGFAGIDPKALLMPTVQAGSAPIGTIRLNGCPIRVWGGLGDLQAAAYGMGFPNASAILINLGTGSQVLALPPRKSENIEVRPCAQGELAHAITHIPSGRAMNAFASFIDECARLGGGQPIFWRMFSELTAEEVLEAEACIDLNVFSAAWQYNGGGSINHICEDTFHTRWLMRCLTKSWLMQYVQALTAICAEHPSPTFLLCGGLSRRSPIIQKVLESLLGKRSLDTTLRTGEETLDGLLKLAETSV